VRQAKTGTLIDLPYLWALKNSGKAAAVKAVQNLVVRSLSVIRRTSIGILLGFIGEGHEFFLPAIFWYFFLKKVQPRMCLRLIDKK